MTVWNVTLPFNTGRIQDEPPSILAYGPPGSGKTTETFIALSRMTAKRGGVLYIEKAGGTLRAFDDLARSHPELGLVGPAARLTLDGATLAAHYGGSMYAAMTTLYQHVTEGVDRGTFPFGGIMLDDWNEICELVYAELKALPASRAPQHYSDKSGKQNIFAVMDSFRAFHRLFATLGRRTKRAIGFTSHYQLPKYDEEPASRTYGLLKTPGGPKMPMGLGSEVVSICGEVDVVVHFVVEELLTAKALLPPLPGTPVQPAPPTDPALLGVSRRKLLTQLEPTWFRKVRGFNVAAEVPIDARKQLGLYSLLQANGYPV